MNAKKHITSETQPSGTDAADLDSLFNSEARSEFQATATRSDPALQQTARDIAPKLEELLALIDKGRYTSLRPRAVMFSSAIKQITSGHAGYLNFGIATAIDTFQGDTLKSLSTWNGVTCYPDVIDHRNRLGKIVNEYFPVLNRILEMVDYHTPEQK